MSADHLVSDYWIEFQDGHASIMFEMSSGSTQKVSLTTQQSLYIASALVRFSADTLKQANEKSIT